MLKRQTRDAQAPLGRHSSALQIPPQKVILKLSLFFGKIWFLN